jgi:hypothetical protein
MDNAFEPRRLKKAAREIEKIRAASKDGKLHLADIVEFARTHPQSECHRHFTWDVQEAAQKYWIVEARDLVGKIEITLSNGSPAPAWISLTTDREQGGGYRPVGEVMSSAQHSTVLLEQLYRELDRLKAKYAFFTHLHEIWDTVDRVRKRCTKT